MTAARRSPLQAEIRQNKPFRSLSHEATVALLLTAERINRHTTGLIEPAGLSTEQYNVLRILRGAGQDPLPVLEIAARMIHHTPGITRLLDKLEEKGLVDRRRCKTDRRQVHCRITEGGLALLASLDEAVDRANRDAFAALRAAEVESLLDSLARIRARLQHKGEVPQRREEIGENR